MQENKEFEYYLKTKEIQGVPVPTGLDWFKVIGNFISFATVVIQGFTEVSKSKKKLAEIRSAVNVYPKSTFADALINEIKDILDNK